MVATTKPLRSNPSLQPIKWTQPENLHITLRFLGNISKQQYQCIDQKIRLVIKNINGFQITLTTLQSLPNTEKFHVLTVKATPYVRLTTLALAIDRIVTTCGIPKEKRPFNPHLTLGRINNQSKINPSILHNIILPSMSFDATAIKLFKSEPGPDRSVYTAIGIYGFNNNGKQI